MKKLFVTGMIIALIVSSCKDKGKETGATEKKVSGNEQTKTVKSDDVPAIDIAS